jgi:heat shock protein HslJ
MRKTTIPAAFAAICLLLSLTSCERGDQTEKIEEDTIVEVTPEEVLVTDLASFIGSEWKLVDLCGEAVPEDSRASLMFLPEERITGSGSVNRFNGTLRLVDGSIEVGPLATTRMAGPPEDMERESAFMAALGSAKSISTIDEDQLIIAVEDKELPLRFKVTTRP